MNIRDKLKKLDTGSEKNKSKFKKEKTQKKSIVSTLGGKLRENDEGCFYKYEKKYSLNYKHGRHCLHKINKCKLDNLRHLFNKEFNDPFNCEDLLFIDTETTGLAGGTGTVPFMVGLGYFSENNFIVEQLFMRDFDEEFALLRELKKIISSYPVIVSFNGKSFDLPLLETRLVMNKCDKFKISFHFDLLHASRRLWSYLNSCSLHNLENKKLNISRNNYLPGSEVPEIYFNYLQNKDPEVLRPVFKHNLIDIISLVTLLNHLNIVLDSEEECELESRELFNLGKIFEKEKKIKKSVKYYEKSRKKCETSYLMTDIEIKLSWQYKRLESWVKAVNIWEKMITENRGELFPYIELAKYYEHQVNKYSKAAEYTEKGLDYLQGKRRIKAKYDKKKNKLKHRLNRLEEKMSKYNKKLL